MAHKVHAPWSDSQVAWLRGWQAARFAHPYTCGRCRDELDVEGVLEPRNDGWHCSTCPPENNPVQTWALLPSGPWRYHPTDVWRVGRPPPGETVEFLDDSCYVCGGPAGGCRCCAFCEKRRCECGETA